MGVPVTARLDEDTVAAVDRAVEAGAAPTRAAAVAAAVREWLDRRSEELIAESYRHAYAELDPAHEELVTRVGSYSAGSLVGRNG